MNLQKVSINDRDIIRKRRVSTNCIVSYWREQFDCDGHSAVMTYGRQKPKPNFGTSKMEHKVSNHYLVKAFIGTVNGS